MLEQSFCCSFVVAFSVEVFYEIIMSYLTRLFESIPSSVDFGIDEPISDLTFQFVILDNVFRDLINFESHILCVFEETFQIHV